MDVLSLINNARSMAGEDEAFAEGLPGSGVSEVEIVGGGIAGVLELDVVFVSDVLDRISLSVIFMAAVILYSDSI